MESNVGLDTGEGMAVGKPSDQVGQGTTEPVIVFCLQSQLYKYLGDKELVGVAIYEKQMSICSLFKDLAWGDMVNTQCGEARILEN